MKEWHDEECEDLSFTQGCNNCAHWQAILSSDLTARLHKAADHVYFTGSGLRMGRQEPDRWVSCTTSAAVVLMKAKSGMLLHRIRPQIDDVLDLRFVNEDFPYFEDLCKACKLPKDCASYCAQWGKWLQEVLLDRCSQKTYTRSVVLTESSIPDWVYEIAYKVTREAYRRDTSFPSAGWRDIWAFFQEWRLGCFLDKLMSHEE